MTDIISKRQIIEQWKFNNSWTLFLDRDGVINQRKIGAYITMIDEFEFIDGALQALNTASKLFDKIIVVTNQQGIGKGIMTNKDLMLIHEYMVEIVDENKGRIDSIYFSPYLAESNHHSRKPNTGMAMQAAKDFPQINFNRSIMVGDAPSDMIFAQALGMKAVFIGTPDEFEISKNNYDLSYPSLLDFIKDINSIINSI